MTLHAISQSIRNVGGEILLCGNQSFGYVFRAEVKGRVCIIVSPSGKQPNRYPFERNARFHIVSTRQQLEQWLASISQSSNSSSPPLPIALPTLT